MISISQIKKKLQHIKNPKGGLGGSDDQRLIQMYKDLKLEIEQYTTSFGKMKHAPQIIMAPTHCPQLAKVYKKEQFELYIEEFKDSFRKGELPPGVTLCSDAY